LIKINFSRNNDNKYILNGGTCKDLRIPVFGNFLEMFRYNAALNANKMIKGIDYYRGMEYPVTMLLLGERNLTNHKSKKKLLDVGSLDTPFPLSLAAKGYEVYALDTNKMVLKLENTAKKLGIYNLKSMVANATKLPFDYNSFDIVTAISALEHALPVKDGDSRVIEEIGKVLKPDGIAIITVPYNNNNFSEEWRHHSVHGKYLMRNYDKDNIYLRLIKPSGLTISKIFYICDDIDFYKLWYKLLVYLLAPISCLFAWMFLKVRVEPINAKGAVIVLEKKGKHHNQNIQVKNLAIGEEK
jgi:SAM-dependent methyltransferase